MHYCSVNGQISAEEKATVGVRDLALLRGYGIFDFFLFKYGQPLLEGQYLDRFFRSAQQMHLEVPMSRPALSQHIRELIASNGQSQGAIRLVLTGGYTEDGYAPHGANLIVMQHGYPNYPPSCFSEGVGLITHAFQREWPEVKTINYLTGIKLLPEIRRAGALEVLYHHQGMLREAVRSNIFLVSREGVLITPGRDILFGITRRSVLEIADGLLPVEIRPVKLEEVFQAGEVFITGSNKSAMPVVRIDGKPIGDGRVGPWSKKLRELLEEFREQDYRKGRG